MPIKGLTDRVRAEFPILGKLRKGSARKQGAGGKQMFGTDLDHFRFTSDREAVEQAFYDAYGPEPRLINVFLPHAELSRNWEAWMEEWTANGLVHRCDGETMSLWLGDDEAYHREPRPCPYATGEKERSRRAPGCRQVGRLTMIIPQLWAAGHVGYVLLETHSINDILGIQGTLEAILRERQQMGAGHMGLQGIQFNLRRVPETISTPGRDGGRVRRVKWLVKLEPAAEWARMQLAATCERALRANWSDGARPLLEAGADESEIIDGVTRDILAPESPWGDGGWTGPSLAELLSDDEAAAGEVAEANADAEAEAEAPAEAGDEAPAEEPDAEPAPAGQIAMEGVAPRRNGRRRPHASERPRAAWTFEPGARERFEAYVRSRGVDPQAVYDHLGIADFKHIHASKQVMLASINAVLETSPS